MTEILTESFCERCGTRYTFETVQQKGRGLGALGTLGRGLRHFVLTSDSSFDESMAVARSEAEQRVTAAQLEAFHRTFNFCLSCRQYTCADCWNAVEGRCLSCAQLPADEVVRRAGIATAEASPIVELPAIAFPPAVDAAPAIDITAPVAPTVARDVVFDAEPAMPEAPPELEALTEPEEATEPQPESGPVAVVEAEAEPEPESVAAVEPEPQPIAAPEVEAAPEPVAAVEPEPLAAVEPEREPGPVAAVEAGAQPPETSAPERAPAPAAGKRRVALPEFLPGRSLDEEIAAYELRVAALAESPAEPLPPIVVAATRPAPETLARAQASPRPLPLPVPDAIEPSAPAVATPGTCRACGLSISASARFCRRCGTAQVA